MNAICAYSLDSNHMCSHVYTCTHTQSFKNYIMYFTLISTYCEFLIIIKLYHISVT